MSNISVQIYQHSRYVKLCGNTPQEVTTHKVPRKEKAMKTINGSNTEQPTYDFIIEKNCPQIHRRPTRQDRDELHKHKEVEHVLVDISVPYVK